jgi:biopolymer transport protein ExbB/TolQ
MKNRFNVVMISVGAAFVLELVLVLLLKQFPGNRILIMLGGDFPTGIIQAFTFFLFFFGLLDIRDQLKFAEREQSVFKMKILPEKENWILSPQDVVDIRMKVVEIEKKKKYFLTDLIKKTCNKYRSDKSPGDALQVLSEQVKINLANSESEQSLIRYVAWAIPSVGFIGTVIGIANSLGYAKDAASEGGIEKITSALSVAFDTTLVALFLSIILMFFYHNLQERVEKLHSKSESYIIENLINRIYK